MSSEEVAELAQAIHNHADALYESWTKGQEAMNMRRMEDTLELLADPGLTPKLEHLVSSFVRRDKAKRQFHRQQTSPPKTSLDPQDIQAQNEREPSPGSFSRKALPKSILAVVQRFEQPASSTGGRDISRERSPSSLPSSNLETNGVDNCDSGSTGSSISKLSASIPGVGPVTRNVIWAEASNRHQATERKVGRMPSPVLGSSAGVSISPTHSQTLQRFGGGGDAGASTKNNSPFPSPTNNILSEGKMVNSGSGGRKLPSPVLENNLPVNKERHIPIERYDEPSNTQIKTNGYSSPKPKNPVVTINTPQISPPLCSSVSPDGRYFKHEMRELEREEERLFHALRTGQLVHGTFSSHHSPTQNVPQDGSRSGDSSPSGTHSPNNNGYSRVAFAKERIRQSQQHPLTQQRLELQKRLPSPSGSLAAAIAVQQGKLKFQPPPLQINGTPPPTPLTSHPLFNAVEEEAIIKDSQYTGGYHNRFNGFRFGAGSSVADRVQMFEKYPSSTISLNNIALSQVVHSDTPPPQSPSSPIGLVSPPRFGSPNQGLGTGADSINGSVGGGSIVAVRKLQLQQQPSSLSSTAPWRCSPNRENGIVTSSTNVNSLAPSSNGTQQPYQHFQIHIETSSGIPKGQSFTPKAGGDSSRGIKRAKDVPRFYFPEGKPSSLNDVQDAMTKAEEKMKSHNGTVSFADFGDVLSAIGLPIFWKKPFWMAMNLGPDESLSAFIFIPFLRNLFADCPDYESKFARLLNAASQNFQSNNNNNNDVNGPNKSAGIHDVFKKDVKNIELTMSDFVPMIQDIVDTHQGLGFLRDAPEFHSRYITTVVSRIFYKVNRSWSGRLTLSELRRSNLMRIIKRLETETDINNITEYFSYEHFYVIYCKFWELDKDHDLLIDKTDLRGHADHALSSRIIERIFSGTVLRGWDMTTSVRAPSDKMTYSDFVWFLLSEEDKKTHTAIEYWFRCLDLDGDGVLSPFELQYFYCEQETRIEALGIEPLDFANVYCQVVDMLQCSTTGIRLKDLKRNPQLAANVFNTLFNLDKYLEHEQRDPFAAAASGSNSLEGFEGDSDWDKYAAAEYELLIAEETPSDHMHNSDLDDATSPT